MSGALPFEPERSGVFQSRSVGPLPATKMIAGKGPFPGGRTSVPRIVIESSSHSTSTLPRLTADSLIRNSSHWQTAGR
jgi:hypothetical protein